MGRIVVTEFVSLDGRVADRRGVGERLRRWNFGDWRSAEMSPDTMNRLPAWADVRPYSGRVLRATQAGTPIAPTLPCGIDSSGNAVPTPTGPRSDPNSCTVLVRFRSFELPPS